jgi:hypothetical protein
MFSVRYSYWANSCNVAMAWPFNEFLREGEFQEPVERARGFPIK